MIARRRLLASLCLSPLIWGMAAPAFAEAAEGPVADDGEILVTARRVEEKVRDVPATISVLTDSAIRASGVTVATDFVQLVPGVTIVTGNVEAGDVQISVRGLTGPAMRKAMSR